MKRKLQYSLGLGMAGLAILAAPLVSLGRQSASAACAMAWEKVLGDEDWSINACSGKSADGTFASTISDDNIVTVNLENYKGEAFVLKGYGTGVSLEKVVFELKGENEVTAENGIAFLTESTPVEFTGEGSLKITSLVPMMTHADYVTADYQRIQVSDLLKDYVAYWQGQGGATSEITIRPTTIVEQPTVVEKPDNTEMNNNLSCLEPADDKETWTTAKITICAAIAIYIVLSLATFIFLGIRKLTRKHATQVKKMIVENNGKKVGEVPVETKTETKAHEK